jgi:DNA-binding response OmpR family regulator
MAWRPRLSSTAKYLQAGCNPRNNFAFDALIWGQPGTPVPGPEVFDVANILIVDDDPAVQLTIRLLLERTGHHVTVAGDGRSITPDAYSEPDFLKMATKLGAVASLHKPFRADALLAVVDRCLTSAPSSSPPQRDAGTGSR